MKEQTAAGLARFIVCVLTGAGPARLPSCACSGSLPEAKGLVWSGSPSAVSVLGQRPEAQLELGVR